MKNNALLGILPVFYLALAAVFLLSIHRFYIFSPDPVYAYLFNSANIAQGHLSISYVDHPGTTLQYFAAIIIFIQHLFSGHHNLVYQDVLLNPEKYLFVISIILTALLCILTFFTGTYVLKKTGDLLLAFLFQLGPLAWGVPINTSALRPEALIAIIGVFFIAYLYVDLIRPAIGQGIKTTYKHAILTGIATGFFIACKFTCLPLLVLIPFLLNGYRQRLAYLGISIISFFFFIIPAIHKVSYMWSWLTKLALHQGIYGNGPKGIINPATFMLHLKGLFFSSDITFPVIYLFITVAFVLCMIGFIRRKTQNDASIRIITGLWIITTLTLLIVAKQYKYYYLLAAQLCFPLDLLVAHKILAARSGFYAKNKSVIASILGILLLACFIPTVIISANEGPHNSAVMQTQKIIKQYNNVPVISVTDITQESAMVEPAISFGLSYVAPDLRYTYYQLIKKHYPYFYGYIKWNSLLIHWDQSAVPAEIFSKRSKVIVYFRGINIQGNETEHNLMQKFCTLPSGLVLGTYKKVYTDTNSYEDIYEIDADSALATKLLANNAMLFCNMKALANHTEIVSSDMLHSFGNSGNIDSSERFSEYNSIMLDHTSPYGLSSYFKVKPGCLVKASVWKKSPDCKGGIVMSAPDDNLLYVASAAIADTEKGWEKIECTCPVPASYDSDSLSIYLFYPGDKKAYFSNLSITLFPMVNPKGITYLTCNMEKRTHDGIFFYSEDKHYLFNNGRLLNTKQSHGGNSSICLDTKNRCGMYLPLNVEPGDSVCIRVWRKSKDHLGEIVLGDSNTKLFYLNGSTLTDVSRNGWEQIEGDAVIPSDYPGKNISFSLYYNGSKQAWFDDLSIRVYRK